MMADRVGQQLGSYRLIRLLGRGGFAEVYLGEHIYLKSLAAIKVMHARLADEDMEGFLTEARTVVRLTHPHIVRVLDFGVEGNTPFLVMDYAPNGTLRQRHPKGTLVPPATVVGYVKQMAGALQYAHDQKLVHRDVKPENMLLGRNDEVLLSDFGIAIVAQTSISQGIENFAGTIEYMAPEQLQGHSRPASDQYALAVVVYEWLSGERPFRGSFLETAAQQSFALPTPLREMIPTLSPAVESVVMAALAKDQNLRFADVRAFAALLELAVSQPSSPARISVPLNSSPQPDVTLLPSGLLSRLSDAAASNSSNRVSQPGSMITPPDQTLKAQVTNTPVYSSPVTPIPLGDLLPSEESYSSKQGISRRAILFVLVFLVIAGNIALFSPTLIKWVITAKLPPNAHTPFCVTASSSASTNYAMFGFNPQRTHFVSDERRLSPTNVSRLVPCWTVHTGGEIYSSPAVLNRTVYIGSGDKLYAFSAVTGTQLWSVPTGGKIWSSPAIANGIVYVGSSNHKLYAFNAISGTQLWTASTGGDIYISSPAIANGVIYIGSRNSKLYAFNAKSGAQLWSVPTEYYILSSPAIANGVVYVGSGDKLYAFNAVTGRQIWVTHSGYSYYNSPAIANGVVYIGSYYNKLYAFNATTGSHLWTAPTGGKICSSPAIANGVIYIGSLDGKLYAFNATTGTQLWTARIGNSIYSSPAIVSGVIYIGSYDDKLYAFHLPK